MRRSRRPLDREGWSGYFRAWLLLSGWGWGWLTQCDFATLPVGDAGWKRVKG